METNQNHIACVTKALKPIAKVTDLTDEQFAFCATFARVFSSEIPNYDLGNDITGATRSNWTYHTSHALAQTAKIFGYDCKFECNGKRDAVIEDPYDGSKVQFFAEWEWDYDDIFGKGKELEKLRDSCRTTKTADAFLLVYSPEATFTDYMFKIVRFWQRSFSRHTVPPALFLNTIIFRPTSSAREFISLNSSMVHHNNVSILSNICL